MKIDVVLNGERGSNGIKATKCLSIHGAIRIPSLKRFGEKRTGDGLRRRTSDSSRVPQVNRVRVWVCEGLLTTDSYPWSTLKSRET